MRATIDNTCSLGIARASRRLTPRQLEILRLLAKGFYYKEIGMALGISPSTVRAHLHSTYRKLEVNSRSRAVIKFHELAEVSAANADRQAVMAALPPAWKYPG